MGPYPTIILQDAALGGNRNVNTRRPKLLVENCTKYKEKKISSPDQKNLPNDFYRGLLHSRKI
jgi:hypothetical protein